MNLYDVLVIGAGPAGLTAAEELARAGRLVAVLEEHAQIGSPVNCSGVLGVEAFDRFLLPEALVRHRLQEVEFVSPRGRRWRFDAGRSLASVVLRGELDRFLGDRAMAAGATVLLGHEATAVSRGGEGVTVTVRTNGETRQLRARALVVATGAGMPLLRTLGFDDIPDRLLGVQTEMASSVKQVEVFFGRRWAPEGFGWIVPLGNGLAKVGLLCDRDGPRSLARFLARGDVAVRVSGEPGPVLCSVLPIGFLSRSYEDRIVVVGEAAGHIKATTCGGIYYGMLAATIAAETLHEALAEDRLEAKRLAAYEVGWRRLLQEEIENGLKLRRSFKLIGDWGVERLMGLAERSGVEGLIRREADFDWHRGLIRSVFRDSTLGRILRAGSTEERELAVRQRLREFSPV